MKKLTALFLTVVMLVAMVAACIPANAAEEAKENVMLCTDDEGFAEFGKSVADWQWAGNGNVFYYNYHKLIGDGKTPNGKNPGGDYNMRYTTDNGGGTASVCDGVKTSGAFEHKYGSTKFTVGDKSFDHAFGYSFKEAVTVDSFAFYCGKDVSGFNNIIDLSVYGAKYDASKNDAGEWQLLWSSTESVQTNSYTDDNGTAAVVTGEFDATEIEYIFFAVNTQGDGSKYKVYEAELFAPVVPAKENVMLITQEMVDAAKAENAKVVDVAKYHQYGCGNVFYYDYLKYIADGKTPNGSDPGPDYKLRLPTYSGSGTAAMCDGVKDSSGTSHSFTKGEFEFAGKTYDHAFGYCFKEAVTVDEFAFYTSAKTDEKKALITGLDVYGGSLNAAGEVEYKLLWSSGTANIQDTKTADGAAFATGTFDAVTINYIRFAVTTSITEGSSSYRPYEAELFAADAAPVVPEDTTAATTEAPAEDTSVTDPGATGDSAFVFVAIAVVAVLGVAVVAKRRFN